MVLVDHLPRESALARQVHGDNVDWDMPSQLLAAVIDQLRVANWQRTQDGQKGRRPPKPTPRPGVNDGTRRYGRTTRDPEEVKDLLRQIGPKRG